MMHRILLYLLGVMKAIFLPITKFLEYIGGLGILFWQTCLYVPSALPFTKKSKAKYIVAQLKKIAFDALPIVILMAFLLGTILALQAAKQLERFGASLYIANLVGISLSREIGPILISIIIAGRTGSSTTSEIGTMLVTEELTALKAMGIDPIQILVMPKMVAMLIGLPALVLIGDLVGIAAGFFVGCGLLGIPFGDYYAQTVKVMSLTHIWVGIRKCFSFAIIITMIGCYRGFCISGGAEGVGRETTNSVVHAIVSIIAVNSLFTIVFFYAR
ncbi:MlaE family ABC transporter permease [Candidatus Uabimicrobium amorphum]|uniref:Sulfate transporter n=1 Tax=Uabimicrobium amorphum TaxID=2596890 RepID=A0A5S9IT98_UABAM|nr:ABC transporter permease [Candidatus Uabimicrobium amorphum]BBM87011.1 sulfate transporter [Candidatus Uabimicrobium amorphum]